MTGERPRGDELRCYCRKLVCMIVGNDVHLKCGRCKRVLVIETKGIRAIHPATEMCLPVRSLGTTQ